MWTSRELKVALRSKPVLVALTAQLSALGGGLTGYYYAMKTLDRTYSDLANQEIADAKLFYAKMHKREQFADPITALEETVREHLMEATPPPPEEEIVEAIEVIEEATEEVTNIFEIGEAEEAFDLESEIRMRKPERPYLITVDEHTANEDEYEQSTLTFYEGDDTLTDSRDKPIPEPDLVVGDDNLLRFGVASGDPNVVYVRNDKLKMDFEILRSSGKFTVEVLGFIEHSDMDRRPRKFRRGHDE
jgi:hypothetical protein